MSDRFLAQEFDRLSLAQAAGTSRSRSPGPSPLSRTSSSSRFLKRILTSRTQSEPDYDSCGRLGLNTLSMPSDPFVEYVFVHGLGGGSTRTWSYESKPSFFWPKEWLPHHPAFRHVRIHSFGYNSDWKDGSSPVADVRDFGQALLLSLRNSPSFAKNPIVFVAHSMGGLVVKQAYILARQDSSCHEMASRISAMVFLATPHRGSDYAAVLNDLLKYSALRSMKPYISDLERRSASLVAINDTFRHYADALLLYSYFETRALNTGIGSSAMIVQKDSAIMGLPSERVSMLDADHRTICKFSSPEEANYILLTDAFDAINKGILEKLSSQESNDTWNELHQIEEYLGLPETPEDDLKDLDELRMERSCDWFTDRPEFQAWMTSPIDIEPRFFWIFAKPATGKSILASHIVITARDFNSDCCYYFFRHGDKVRSTLAGCLRSLVVQMATLNRRVRLKIITMIERGVRFEQESAKSIWRKIVEPVLQSSESFRQPQLWVLDALDECVDITTFFSFIHKLDPTWPVKILVTGRRTEEIAAGFAQVERMVSPSPLISMEIQAQDTHDSIKLYLESNKEKLHVGTEEQRQDLLRRISEKSQGCFLWVRLVLEELSTVWTVKQVEQVLEDVPQEMDDLYSRAIDIISSKPAHSVAIARAILMWTICAIRPMSVVELQAALERDIGSAVNDPEHAFPALCSQLVHVDKSGRVLVVHLTARTFLQNRGLDSSLAICPIEGHRRIAEVCLELLVSDEMKPPNLRRAASGRKRPSQPRSALMMYAAFNFSEHMRKTSSNNTILGSLLYEMLQKNIFTWIELIATNNSLYILTRTANLIENYFQRQTKYFPPLGEQIQLASSWAVDLHRLVAKFGKHLVRQPTSIYSIIPPFCPLSSAVASVFGNPGKRIRLVGLEDNSWDDRLACIGHQSIQAYAVACGEGFFAIGFGSEIVLCSATTCQEWKTLHHGSVVKHLAFDGTGALLISAGRRDIKVWELEGTNLRHTFSVASDVLSLSALNEDSGLLAVLKNNTIIRWRLTTGERIQDDQWRSLFEDEGHFRRPPLLAALSPDETLLAIAHRGRPIVIWDVEENELCGYVGREGGDLESLALGTNTSPSSLVFNREESLPLLAAAFEDGDLCLFDYDNLTLLHKVEANAQILACSTDGTILATGNSSGMVQLLDFETLHLLFRVNAVDYGIRSLAFSADNLRFMDVRGTQCNVWEPVLPSGKTLQEDASSNPGVQEPRIVGLSDGELEITTLITGHTGAFFFVGKSDGTVWLYGTRDGKPAKLLYRHGYEISVLRMAWGARKDILVTTDAAGRFIVSRLAPDRSSDSSLQLTKLIDVKGGVQQQTAICNILLDDSNDLLLVSTAESDVVWDITSSKVISSVEYEYSGRGACRWVNNPIDKTERLLLDSNGVSMWDWRTCMLKSPPLCLHSPSPNQPQFDGLVVENAMQLFSKCVMAQYSGQRPEVPSKNNSTSPLLLNMEKLEGGADAQLPAFSEACKSMIHLIGVHQEHLVFLDDQLRVCTAQRIQVGKKGSIRVTSHFFIPSDWVSQRRDLLTDVTPQGDILFVRSDRVAVIKHGLAFENTRWDVPDVGG